MNEEWGFAAEWPRRIFARMARGWRRRVRVTLALVLGGLAWPILYAIFLASQFAWYLNLLVILATALFVPLAIFAVWTSWRRAFRHQLHDWVGADFDDR